MKVPSRLRRSARRSVWPSLARVSAGRAEGRAVTLGHPSIDELDAGRDDLDLCDGAVLLAAAGIFRAALVLGSAAFDRALHDGGVATRRTRNGEAVAAHLHVRPRCVVADLHPAAGL